MALDWLSTVSGSALGIAGIASGVWIANISRKTQIQTVIQQNQAEERRSALADKRALYAKFLNAGQAVFNAVTLAAVSREDAGEVPAPGPYDDPQAFRAHRRALEDHRAHLERSVGAMEHFQMLLAEVYLVGGPLVGPAAQVVSRTLNHLSEADDGRPFRQAHRAMIDIMRLDLDLPLSGDLPDFLQIRVPHDPECPAAPQAQGELPEPAAR